MKGTKRILSGLLALCMVISMLPVQAFAEEEIPEETAVVTEAATEPAEETTVPAETEAEPESTQETETAVDPTEETTVPVDLEDETVVVTGEPVNEVAQEANCDENHTAVIDEAVESSCTETGLTEGSHCSECGEVLMEQEEIPALGHRVYIEESLTIDPLTVDNTDVIPFALIDGKYYSNNHEDESSSQLQIRARYDCTLTLTYGVSSEAGYDELYILCNDVEEAVISGNVTNQTMTLNLMAGDELTICYSKDVSVSDGLDQGWVLLNYNPIVFDEGDVSADILEPDCTNAVICTYCQSVVKEALGHNVVIDAADCIAGLTEGRHCSTCGEVFVAQEVIPGKGHTEVIDEAAEPSCTETGLTEGSHCSVCGKIFVAQEEIPALGHRVYIEEPVGVNPLTVDNTDVIPFNLIGGKYYSNNHDDESSSQLQIRARYDCILTLTYGVSSEADYDELYILCNDVEEAVISGDVTNETMTLDLMAGDVVTVRYTKDSIVNNGQDRGWVALDYQPVILDSGDVPADILPGCINAVVCSYCQTVVKEISGHTEVIDAAVEANCSNSGLTEGKHCSACGEVFAAQEEIPANGIHVFEKGVCTACGLSDGTCGENVYWTFEENTGTLTISGRGAMDDYDSSAETPWSDYLEEIEAVVLKSGITDIGSYAFESCVNLTSVVIPDSVNYMEDYCFSGCSSLKEVTIPGSVYMREGVFMECTNLETVVLSEDVSDIGDYAFLGCSALKSINIPQSIFTSYSGIGEYAFSGCESLVTISTGTADLNGHYDGSYYYGGTFSDCTGLQKAIVSDLPGYVFSGCSNLEEVVVLTDNYANMMYGAFAGCDSLSTVTFLGAYPYDIDPDLFDGRVVTVYYPAGIPEWDAVAGNNYGGELTWVPLPTSGSCGNGLTYSIDVENGVLTISGNGTMDSWDCVENFAPWYGYRSVITNVVVEDGVATFNHLGFAYPTITFLGDAPKISANAFAGRYDDFAKQVYYPAGNATWNDIVGKRFGSDIISWAVKGSAVEQIKAIYENAESMTQEEIRAAVQVIDYDDLLEAMRSGAIDEEIMYPGGFTELTELTVEDVPELTSVIYWSGIYWLGLNDPVDAASEAKVILSKPKTTMPVPNGYIEDGKIAFNLSITNIRNTNPLDVPIVLNLGLSHQLEDPFSYSLFWRNSETGQLEEVPYTLSWAKLGFDMNCVITGTGDYLWVQKAESLSGTCGEELYWEYNHKTLTISGIGAMDDYDLSDNLAPWNCFRENVDYLIIEDGVTSIGDYAFNDCRFVSSITVPASVVRIGEGAFYGMYNASLVFEGDAPVIENKAFYGMRGTAYYDPDKAGWEEAVQSYYGAQGYYFAWEPIEKSGTCGKNLTWQFEESTGTLTVSGTGDMNYYIEEKAPWLPFSEKIKTIIIEEGVTSISAFYMCSNVEELMLPDSLITLSFDEGTLPPMEEITVPAGVMQIYTAGGASGYINIHVAEENQVYASIDGVLFNKDKTELLLYPGGRKGAYVVPDGVTHISERSFVDNTNITAVTLPKNLISIGEIAFSHCTALTEIVIPDNVTTVGNRAFGSCSSLQKISFGKNVDSIGEDVLAYCYCLDEIIFTGDAPVIGEWAFSGVEATAYYPADNETWTADMMKNYSGTITWVAYDEEPGEMVGTVTSGNWTMSLDQVIYLNYYPTLTGWSEGYDFAGRGGVVVWTGSSNPTSRYDIEAGKPNTVTIHGMYQNADGKWYVQTDDIFAQNLGDRVYIRPYVMTADGEYIYQNGAPYYSPALYCYDILNNLESDENTRNVCAALLEYGAEAQKYFGNDSNLVTTIPSGYPNIDLSSYAETLTYKDSYLDPITLTDHVRNIAGTLTGTRNGITLGVPTLALEGAIRLSERITINGSVINADNIQKVEMLFWTADQIANLDTLAYENLNSSNTWFCQMEDLGNGTYSAKSDFILAKNMGQMIYYSCRITMNDGSVYRSGLGYYNVEGFISDTLADSNSRAAEVCRRLAVYGEMARIRFT